MSTLGRGMALGALLLTLMVGPLPARAQDEGPPVAGGTAVFAVASDPAMVNPNLTTNSPDGIVGCLVYQGLVWPRMDGQVDPLLARSWTASPTG